MAEVAIIGREMADILPGTTPLQRMRLENEYWVFVPYCPPWKIALLTGRADLPARPA